MTMECELDHITVTAHDLDAGVAFVRDALGVVPEGGGEHPAMGTHNRVVHLGPGMYLEVIAPNPAAPRPARPRWFGLDELAPDAPPRLATWAARTSDIRRALAASAEPLGVAEPMSRGQLHWLISMPADGRVPLSGAGPALIEWPAGVHPATSLRDVGLRLVALEIAHPEPERVRAVLRSIGVRDRVRVTPLAAGERPYLAAHIDTPAGPRTLGGDRHPV
jgi:hypothetical protein